MTEIFPFNFNKRSEKAPVYSDLIEDKRSDFGRVLFCFEVLFLNCV